MLNADAFFLLVEFNLADMLAINRKGALEL